MWLVFCSRSGRRMHFVLLRRERVGHDRQRLVLHLHGFGAVLRRAARLGKHRRDFLVLEQHLADRQHHLLVEAVERRQPAQARGFEVLAGDDRLDARHLHRLADVDVLDGRVWIRAARDRGVEHAGHRDVVHVAPLPWRKRGSSFRFMRYAERVPFGFASMLMACPRRRHWSAAGRLAHHLCRLLNGLDDVLVAGAAAHIARQAFTDLGFARSGLCSATRTTSASCPACSSRTAGRADPRSACWIGCSAPP